MKYITANADQRIKYEPPYTKEYVESLFENIPKNEDGTVSFHDVQEIIFNVREKRVLEFKKMYPDLTKKDNNVYIK